MSLRHSLRSFNYENVYRKLLNCLIFNALNASIFGKSYYWRLLKSVFRAFICISQKLKVREENSLLWEEKSTRGKMKDL